MPKFPRIWNRAEGKKNKGRAVTLGKIKQLGKTTFVGSL